MKKLRDDYQKGKRAAGFDGSVRASGGEKPESAGGYRSEEPEEEMPLIRETIVRKFFWKEALFIVGAGVLIAAVLGLSVGIGVSYIAPLLRERHESIQGIDRLFGEAPSMTPTTPPVRSSEEDPEASSEPRGTGEEPFESSEESTEEGSGGQPEQTEPEESTLESDPLDPATLFPGDDKEKRFTKEELSELVENYLKDPAHRSEQAVLISELMQDQARTLNKQFVSIRVTRRNTDRWFESPMEANQTVSALVIEQEEDHMLMVTDFGSISQASGLSVSIGQKVLPVQVMSYDLITHLALVRVEITPDVSKSLYHQIRPAQFGSSTDIFVGEMIMAAGSPIGYTGSFAYGTVTYTGEYTNRWDAHYPLIYTDITGREPPLGFLFSMEGKVVGYIDRSSFGGGNMGSLSGYGVERMMPLIWAMQQNRNFSYFGILGENVTEAMARDQGLVKGIYINQTAQDSPAYYSAIQAGDIITAIDGRPCQTMAQLMDQMQTHNPNDVVKVTYYRWSTGGGYQEMSTDLILSGRFVFPEE